jgi:hypothetical protein
VQCLVGLHNHNHSLHTDFDKKAGRFVLINTLDRRYTYYENQILSAILLTLSFFNAISAQTLDKAKLDRFFDRLAEKNQAMGSLTVAKDGRSFTPAPSATARSTAARESLRPRRPDTGWAQLPKRSPPRLFFN